MGLMCLKSALLACLLPETQGQATLETIDDVNSAQFRRSDEKDAHDKLDNVLKTETRLWIVIFRDIFKHSDPQPFFRRRMSF